MVAVLLLLLFFVMSLAFGKANAIDCVDRPDSINSRCLLLTRGTHQIPRNKKTLAEKAVQNPDCENVFIQSNSEQKKHNHRPTRSGHTQKKTMEGLDHGSQSGKTTVTRHTTAAGRAASQEGRLTIATRLLPAGQ